jgi:tetratricopeptide (TPR) repeat protein
MLSGVLVVLAGCAEVPTAPLPELAPRSAHDEQLSRSIAKHRQLAQHYKQSGDLASAATQWQILALLAPNDDGIRHEREATELSIDRRVQENLAAGTTALRSGDVDRAGDVLLKVLALDPDNAEAPAMLREVEKRKLSKIQAGRAAKVNAAAGQSSSSRAPMAPPTAAAAASGNGFDLELPLELFKAGDTAAGLRDLRRYVDANPNDRAARQRIGATVYDRARELEDKGAREQALPLYEQAIALRGDAAPGWNARIQALRKSLGDEYFQKGNRAYPTDVALAIKQWETSLRFDPQNAKAAARLSDARQAHDKLKHAQ